MRTYDIAYVPNVKNDFAPVDYKKMGLKELVDKYIKMCAIANGKVSVCSKCEHPCDLGKRAVQLLSNVVYNDPPIPLYGGKTMIENAQAENVRRRKEREEEEKEEKKMENVQVAAKTEPIPPVVKKRVSGTSWWEESVAYGDQKKFLVDKYGYTYDEARKAINSYRYRYGLTKSDPKRKPSVKEPAVSAPVSVPEAKETAEEAMHIPVIVEPKETQPREIKKTVSTDLVFSTIENKIDELAKLQAEYKEYVDKYTKLYNEVKEKIDTLYKAADIFS